VYIVGAGSTKYGKFDASARELLVDACAQALDAAGVDPRDVQTHFLGNAFSVAEKQGHLGPLVNTTLGMPDAPSYTIESACASGSSAFREAFVNVAGGFADVAIASGVERVSQLDTVTATSFFSYGSDYAFEGANGCSFPGLYATMARTYFQKYGATEEDLAHIAVKNHENGALNPKAHIQKRIKVEDVLKSMVVASPLKLYDACPFSDGAAAVVLASEEVARRLSDQRVQVLGSGRAGTVATLQERPDMTTIPSTRLAAEQAFRMAGLEPKDVDLLEVHDCFTIAEAVAIEDLGYAPRGGGAGFARDGVTARDGRLPVNPSGGLKSKGHPVGATGIGQIVEACDQLLVRAGPRQVSDAQVALTHNIGATGGSCGVHLLGV
jgi:acetyl-CoA C-acetyltransferase